VAVIPFGREAFFADLSRALAGELGQGDDGMARDAGGEDKGRLVHQAGLLSACRGPRQRWNAGIGIWLALFVAEQGSTRTWRLMVRSRSFQIPGKGAGAVWGAPARVLGGNAP
jgi:hypothetical protein